MIKYICKSELTNKWGPKMKKFDLALCGVEVIIEIPTYKEGETYFDLDGEDDLMMDKLIDIPNITEVCLNHCRWVRAYFVNIPSDEEIAELRKNINEVINRVIYVCAEENEDG